MLKKEQHRHIEFVKRVLASVCKFRCRFLLCKVNRYVRACEFFFYYTKSKSKMEKRTLINLWAAQSG